MEKVVLVAIAVTLLLPSLPAEAEVPPEGKEITLPSAAVGPGIEELGRSPVSLLTFGLTRIEARLDRLSDKHEADFNVGYDAKEGRIHITVTSRKMKTTKENCDKLIRIVREDANSPIWFDEKPPTIYAYLFANAGEGPANIDSRIDIQVTIDNSFDTSAVTFVDRKTCTGGIELPD